MAISATLTDSLEQHLEQFAVDGKLRQLENELARHLVLIFQGEEQLSQNAAQDFCDTWADFSLKHQEDVIWPLFVYACYQQLGQVAAPLNTIARETLQKRLDYLSNYLLLAFSYKDKHVPSEINLRLQKITNFLRSQSLQSFPSILLTHIMLAGSFPRYLFEYLLLKAKHALGDHSEQLAQETQHYQQHLSETDMDVYFSIGSSHPAINIGQLCLEVYQSTWPALVEAHFGGIVKIKGQINSGYEYLHLRTEENFDIILHPGYQPIIPHGNTYLSIVFHPATYVPAYFSFPGALNFPQSDVVYTFFAKQTFTPTLLNIEQQVKQLNHVNNKQISLLAHCFKNICKLLADRWALSPVDKQAVSFFMTKTLAVRSNAGDIVFLNLMDMVSTRIAALYYQNIISGESWLQLFKGMLESRLETVIKESTTASEMVIKEPASEKAVQESTALVKKIPALLSLPGSTAVVASTQQNLKDPNGIFSWLGEKKQEDLVKIERILLLKELHDIIAKKLKVPLSANSKNWNVISRSSAAKQLLDITRVALINMIFEDKAFLLWFVFLTYCKIDLFSGGDPLIDIFLDAKTLNQLTETHTNSTLDRRIFNKLKSAYQNIQEDSPLAPMPQLHLLSQDAIAYVHVAVHTTKLPAKIAIMIVAAITQFYIQMIKTLSVNKTNCKPISYLFYPEPNSLQSKATHAKQLEYELKTLQLG